MTEAAEYLGASRPWVNKQVLAGVIPSYRIGGLVRVDLNEIDALMGLTK